jgi:hypothetical protein
MRNALRKRILRVHGTLLIVGGTIAGVLSTVGYFTGSGPMPYLHNQYLAHIGLLQAYLLMAVIGGSMLAGSMAADPRPSNRVAAAAHGAILVVYAIHWDNFPKISPEAGTIRYLVFMHLALMIVESVNGFTPLTDADRAAPLGHAP